MQYAILEYDLLSVRAYRDLDENNLPAIKMVGGEPLARPVVWDADPAFDSSTQYLWEATPIIEPTQVRRRNEVLALSAQDIADKADEATQTLLFDTMRTAYSTFNDGTATVAQVQKAIAWLIKQEAIKRGAPVS